MSQVRWGSMNGSELPKNDSALLREGEEADVLNAHGVRNRREWLYVFEGRTRPVRDETNKLWTLIEEAEAFWGHEIRSALQELIKHINKLLYTIEHYFSGDPAYQGDEYMKAHRTIFTSGDEKDVYNLELVEKLEAIAAIVRKKISSLRDSEN